MRSLLLALLLVISPALSPAAVVRLAPDLTFPGVGKSRSLRGLRGQPVVLLITPSSRDHAFKKQVKYLREIYQQFASKQVVFIAAIREGELLVPSDIPFAIASNGAAVADAYGVPNGFQLVIIGKDGNVDYQTAKVCPPERVRDVIQNSFAVQASTRN